MSIKQCSSVLLILYMSYSPLTVCASELIDPTRPATRLETSSPTRVAAPRSWTLESTLVAADRRVAVINGKLVSEGESVDGARVVEIRNLDVLIQTASRRMTLQLLPDIVKKSP